jgi:large subunit ribosomal protein L10
MPTAEKEKVIEQAKDWYSKSSGIVFADYRGLKVKEIQSLRADLRKKGAEIHILKNTLFRRAAGEDAALVSDELHNGTTAYAFVFENEQEVAKALLDYARVSKKLVVKGGFFSKKSLSTAQVEQLSQLPPRDILISQVIGAIAAPLSGLIGTIEALYADPIRVIGAVADKVAEGSPIPAPAAEAAAPSAEAPVAEAVEEPAPETVSPPSETASAEETSAPTPSEPEASPESN